LVLYVRKASKPSQVLKNTASDDRKCLFEYIFSKTSCFASKGISCAQMRISGDLLLLLPRVDSVNRFRLRFKVREKYVRGNVNFIKMLDLPCS